MLISEEEIKVALLNSGYLLEDRVNKLLKANSWKTVPNDRYIDIKTSIEREVDIFALKNIIHQNPYDFVSSCLIIECMNNKEPIVFFQNLDKKTTDICSLKFNILNDNFNIVLTTADMMNEPQKKYIYSSQYCGFQRVQKLIKEYNNGWIASHPDSKHNSIESIFQYIKSKEIEYQGLENSHNRIMGNYYRGLIILQGELLAVKQNEDIEIKKVNHIKYQIPKTENNNTFFTIDVITECYLEKYLKEIKTEDNEISKYTIKHRNQLAK